jgi:hypothetical protein
MEAIARKQRGSLPGSLIMENHLFTSKQEATQYTDGTYEDKKPASRKPESKIATPTKAADPNANLPIKALNKVGLSRLESIKSLTDASYAASKYIAGEPSSISSNYLVSLKMSANLGLVEIRIHIFKYLFQPKINFQIVTFESFDLKQNKT